MGASGAEIKCGKGLLFSTEEQPAINSCLNSANLWVCACLSICDDPLREPSNLPHSTIQLFIEGFSRKLEKVVNIMNSSSKCLCKPCQHAQQQNNWNEMQPLLIHVINCAHAFPAVTPSGLCSSQHSTRADWVYLTSKGKKCANNKPHLKMVQVYFLILSC